jgi:hypothetical protein
VPFPRCQVDPQRGHLTMPAHRPAPSTIVGQQEQGAAGPQFGNCQFGLSASRSVISPGLLSALPTDDALISACNSGCGCGLSGGRRGQRAWHREAYTVSGYGVLMGLGVTVC